MAGPFDQAVRREDPRQIQRGFDRFAKLRNLRTAAIEQGEPGLTAGTALLLGMLAIGAIAMAAL